jgi:hypothetical protein
LPCPGHRQASTYRLALHGRYPGWLLLLGRRECPWPRSLGSRKGSPPPRSPGVLPGQRTEVLRRCSDTRLDRSRRDRSSRLLHPHRPVPVLGAPWFRPAHSTLLRASYPQEETTAWRQDQGRQGQTAMGQAHPHDASYSTKDGTMMMQAIV